MQRSAIQKRVREILEIERTPSYRQCAYERQCALQAEKWTLLCELVARSPFVTRPRLSRSAQWLEAAHRLRDLAPATELIDWALLQADVARNHERGVRDLRPHKDGPCRTQALDYVTMRRDKAQIVLHSAQASSASGADNSRNPSRIFTSPEREPPRIGNPLSRG